MLKSKFAKAIIPASLIFLASCADTQDVNAPVVSPEVVNQFTASSIWSRSTDGLGDFYSNLSPVIVNNNIYAASRDGKVYAFKVENGDKLWTSDISDEPENKNRRSARLSGGVSASDYYVAVGSENGYVYVFSSADGKLLYKQNLNAEVLAKPTFSSNGQKLFITDSSGKITALDTASGKILWQAGFSTQALRLRTQVSPVAIGDEFLIVGQSNGKVSVYLQDTGNIVNEITISDGTGVNSLDRISDISSTPVLIGNKLYVSSYKDGLVTFSFDTNNIVNKYGINTANDIAFDEDNIVVVDEKGYVYCLDRNTNIQKWVFDKLSNRQVSSPCIYGNYVVVGDMEGYLYFLNLSSGNIDSKISVGSSNVIGAPLVHNDKLYVFTKDGKLDCLMYDPLHIVNTKEILIEQTKAFAGVNTNLIAPGVGENGIYLSSVLTQDQLNQRRAAIIKAVKAQEARRNAAIEAQRQAYEQRQREIEAYQKAQEEQLSGYGVMQGVKSGQ